MKKDDVILNTIEFLDSEKGQQSVAEFLSEYAKPYINNQIFMDRCVEKIKTIQNKNFFIEKIINKYTSSNYLNRYKNNVPPYTLYWVFFNYAKKYGRDITSLEWSKYSNPFTTNLYYTDGYYFIVSSGQGENHISVIKENIEITKLYDEYKLKELNFFDVYNDEYVNILNKIGFSLIEYDIHTEVLEKMNEKYKISLR